MYYQNKTQTMSNRIEKMTSELHRILNSNSYRVEIDTEDMVLGFKKTLIKRTKNTAKWLALQIKTQQDIGRFLSSSVRIVEVMWYKDGQHLKTLKALPLN